MKNGQSMIELILAFGISTIIVIALVGLGTTSIRNSTASRNRSQATQYVREATDWLRKERDRDWDVFLTNIYLPACRTNTSCRRCLNSYPLVFSVNDDPSYWNNCNNNGNCENTEVINGVFARTVTFVCKHYESGNTAGADRDCDTTDPLVNGVNAIVTVSWTDSFGPQVVNSEVTLSNWRYAP